MIVVPSLHKVVCDICELPDALLRGYTSGAAAKCTCSRCGDYQITFGAAASVPDELRVFLSCAARQASEQGIPLLVTSESAESLAKAHSQTGFLANQRRLLSYLGKRVGRPGRTFTINPATDFTVIDVADIDEFEYYLFSLDDSGWTVGGGNHEKWGGRLTAKAWADLSSSLQPGGRPGTCFVAMSFDQSMNEAYDLGIRPAIQNDCGLEPIRIDRKHHNNQITDEIMAGIRGAEFMVADFTGHRGGVYYEAGFARGLGRDVIFCCREDSFKDRHFDTSVINHIIWKEPGDLRKQLADRIIATMLPKA